VGFAFGLFMSSGHGIEASVIASAFCYTPADNTTVTDGSGVTASCNLMDSINFSAGTTQPATDAEAYGSSLSMKVSSHSSSNPVVLASSGVNVSASSRAQTIIADNFNFVGGVTNSMFLQVIISVDGNISQMTNGLGGNDAYSTAELTLSNESFNGAPQLVNLSGNAGALSATYNVLLPITPGNSRLIQFDLEAVTGCGCSYSSRPYCFGSVDFFDTASITGVGVVSSKWNNCSGRDAVSLSGVSYPSLSSVPEPSALVLISLGVVGVISGHRMHHAKSHSL
jgi:hypothetical protein